jgi:4-amino-4-deoxy-L-arabinose transferase-like glycosyltransferase
MARALATASERRRIAPPRWRLPRPGAATIWLGAILLVAAGLRAVWIVYATRQPLALHDPVIYLSAGDQLSRGLGYRFVTLGTTAYFPPGFPFALAGVFWIIRHTPLPDDILHAAAAFNAAMGVLAVGLVYVLGRRLLGVATGLVAAAIVALWPNLVFHSGAILSEPLFIVLVLTALAVVLWQPWPAGRIPRGRLLAFGALVGIAALTRPPGLLLVFALAAAAWLGGAAPRRALGQAAIALAVALAVIAPWTVRNAVAMHSPILISANTGDDLCVGHNPDSTGAFLQTIYCEPPPLPSRPATEVRRYRWNTKEGLTYAVHHPWREVQLLGLRAKWTFAKGDSDALDVVESYRDDRFIDRGLRNVLRLVADIWYYVVAALALVGLSAFLRRRDPRRLMIPLSIVALLLSTEVFFGGDRFHVPSLPLVALMAAVPVTRAGTRMLVARPRWLGWRSLAAAALAIPPVLFAVPVFHSILGTLAQLITTSHPYFGDAGGVGVDGLAIHLGSALYGDPAHTYDPNAYTPGLPLLLAGLDSIKQWTGWSLLVTIFSSLGLIGLATGLAWRPRRAVSPMERAANAIGALGMGAIAWWLVLFVAFDALYLGRTDHIAWALALGGLVLVPATAAGSRPAAAGSLLGLTLAFMIKQTTALAALAAVAWLLIAALRGRSAWRVPLVYAAVLLAVNGALLGILQLASGGWAWFWIVDLPGRSAKGASYGDAADHMFQSCIFTAVVAAILWLPLLSRRRRLPRRRLEIAGVLALFAAVEAVVAPVFREGAGAVDNHFVGLAWALALLAACAWGLAGFDRRSTIAAAGVVLGLFAVSELKPLQTVVTDVNTVGVPLKATRGTIGEIPAPLVALAKKKTVYHPVYADLAAEHGGRAYPAVYSLEWLPRGGVRPGYFLDAILHRRIDVIYLFADEGNTPDWGGGTYEDDFSWKLNETIRAKYDPAPGISAIAGGLATRADIRVYRSPGVYQRRPGPDPAPWLARCFAPFHVRGVTWTIGRGGGFWCRTAPHSTVLRLVRTRAARSEIRADGVHAVSGGRLSVRLRRAGPVEVRLGSWYTRRLLPAGRWVEIAPPAGEQGRLSVTAERDSAADVDLAHVRGGAA